MSFFDGIRKQLRSVIEWDDPSKNALFEQWTKDGDELKNASKLIIGPGQGCVFVYQGKVISILQSELMVDLKTENIPFWTTVSKFMQFFESEHKVGLYFFRSTKILNQKWGTRSLIKYEDPKYKFPVGLKAFGNYSFRITDPESFFLNVVGAGNNYSVTDFRMMINSRIIQPLSDFLAEKKYSYTEIDSFREEISANINEMIKKEFDKLGFTITDFRIEGTSFDENTKKRINRISNLIAEAQAAKAVGLDYAKVQQLDAMKDAAKNEGGGAGMGMGLGAGISFGKMMGDNLGDPEQKENPHKISNEQILQKLKEFFEKKL
ncbi:MAG: SPFH domain-containing protein, partial [Candidatus Cloacimonetes bacterium]|nr:SPFH domain-containing protein [Candidatus Cloacimonadota bacterium]